MLKLLLLSCYGLTHFTNVTARCQFTDDQCSPHLEYYDHLIKTKDVSEGGRSFFGFLGIPYAKPPIGHLRFRNPEELDKKCCHCQTRSTPTCMQRNYLFGEHPKIEGQEDCLYLNVYVPQELCPPYALSKVPVMVFIHWGGFIAGQSSPGYLGANYLMDEDIILVTFNYRLGPFGFLSTLDDESPGNYGFKDQVLALKWVHENIAAFGGDPEKVTIFGASAGAASVHYHMIKTNPRETPYFQRAISQSGNALALYATPFNDLQRMAAYVQGKLLGCERVVDHKALMKCLRSVPAEKIMESQDVFKTFYTHSLIIFGPVTEKKTLRNPEPFLTKTPWEYFKAKEILPIPWMTGVTANDGALGAAPIISCSKIREKLNSNFSQILSDSLMLLQLSTNDVPALFKNISKQYFKGGQCISIDSLDEVQGLVNLYSDRTFFYPFYQSILQHLLANIHSQIFVYNFEYEGTDSYISLFSGDCEKTSIKWGAIHCDELLYLFKSKDLIPSQSDHDKEMRKLLVNMWSNFARLGDPNPTILEQCDDCDPWSPLRQRNVLPFPCTHELRNEQLDVLRIWGNNLTGPMLYASKGFFKERMEFWLENDLFENKH